MRDTFFSVEGKSAALNYFCQKSLHLKEILFITNTVIGSQVS